MRRLLLVVLLGLFAVAAACTQSSDGESGTAAPVATATTAPRSEPTTAPIVTGPAGEEIQDAEPGAALTAALEAASGFNITDVTFSGSDVTVKYDQVVNEPSELLLLRWLDFAAVVFTFVDDPTGDIVIVPQVENSDIASVRMRAVDVADFLDGKRSLEDLLAGIEIE